MSLDGITQPLTAPPLPTLDSPAKAKSTGLKDSFLTVIYGVLSYGGVSLGGWLLTNQANFSLGKYEWVKLPLTTVITAGIKGLDRYIHEDPTKDASGIIKI